MVDDEDSRVTRESSERDGDDVTAADVPNYLTNNLTLEDEATSESDGWVSDPESDVEPQIEDGDAIDAVRGEYEPIPQELNVSGVQHYNVEVDWLEWPEDQTDETQNHPEMEAQQTPQLEESQRDNIPLGEEQIESIMTAMRGFSLPAEQVPSWAAVVPETECGEIKSFMGNCWTTPSGIAEAKAK